MFAIFEFVHALVETPKFRGAVKAGLSDLMYYIVLYMQITEDQCEKWTDNPDQFVEEEDEDSFSYSVRISSQDLLLVRCLDKYVEIRILPWFFLKLYVRPCVRSLRKTAAYPWPRQ